MQGNVSVSTPSFTYDAAGRVKTFGSYITGTDYNLRSQPTRINFGNGNYERKWYNGQRGWMESTRVYNSANAYIDRRHYHRRQNGRVRRQWAPSALSRIDYCYDYAGRVLVAAALQEAGKTCATVGSWTGARPQDQFFAYRRDGSMVSNSHLGSYDYSGSPVAHAPARVDGQSFTYDANGNMTRGLDGKQMTYDGENRPLSVTAANGDKTTYIYGADGKRIRRQETVAGKTTTTWYFGGVEFVQAQGKPEQVHWYPHPNLRMTYENGTLQTGKTRYLHRDQLDSVYAITGADGAQDSRRDFAPFGFEKETLQDPDMAAAPEREDFGFIGEREDEAAGLMYLNARYYDPELALFLQPDWFEVTEPGVGTNRYSYSFNDPVNLMDPSGNAVYADKDGDGKNEFIVQGEDIYGPSDGDGWSYLSQEEKSAKLDSFMSDQEYGQNFVSRDWVRGLNYAIRYCSGTCRKSLNKVVKPVDNFFKNTLRNIFRFSSKPLAREPEVAETLSRLQNNSRVLETYMSRNQSLITAAKAIGKFKQALAHVPKAVEFAKRPSIMPSMRGMSSSAIRQQQIARVQKLEKDFTRNMTQGYEIIERYLSR